MQSIRRCVQRLVSQNLFSANKPQLAPRIPSILNTSFAPTCKLHNSPILKGLDADDELNQKKMHFIDYNDVIFPPQKPGEPRRPAYICHVRQNIKYSAKNMWYIANMVRGLSVDEAVKQLSFVHKKGAAIVKEVILEARKLAVETQNVEFESNLWVAESFTTKGIVMKGIRRHARGRPGKVKYRYCHYFVRLEEGKPPENYYGLPPRTGEYLLEKWMKQMRMRKISNSL